MSKNTRFVVALLCAAALAALGTPELTSHLPHGVPQAVAAALSAVLFKMDSRDASADQ